MDTNRHLILSLTAPAIALAMLAGCAETKPAEQARMPREFLQDRWEPQEPPVSHIVRRDYRLREGDQLEVIYHIRHRRNYTYRIKIEDEIRIRFPFHPDMDQVGQVQSDGMLYLDLVGPVDVLDKTVDQVRDLLIAEYSKYIKDPELTVSFDQSNVKIAELKKAITTSPRGQSRLVPITPDGTISLPFIVDIQAAGLTVSQLQQQLTDAYRLTGLDELEVTVNVHSIAPFEVYVFGEVRIPGALLNRTGRVTTSNELTLLQAIAQAGSYLPGRADLSSVLLIRRRHLRRPQAAVINVYQMLRNRKKTQGQPVQADSAPYRYDVWLENGDVIYVPTAEIARRADYIEYVWTRGIRAVTGMSMPVSYTAGDTVDWLGPNP